MIECEPAVRAEVVQVAWPAVTVCAPQPLIVVPPSLNSTVPVAVDGDIAAVNVTESPTLIVALDVLTVVVVAVLSVYTCPVKLPLPVPVPPNGMLLLTLVMESLSTRFRPTVPLLLPVFTVTVYVLSLPLTPVIEAPLMPPVVASAKSAASTPVMFSLKLTVKWTVELGAGLSASARLIDATMGIRILYVPIGSVVRAGCIHDPVFRLHQYTIAG